MPLRPAWLPGIIYFDGNPEAAVPNLYTMFLGDFAQPIRRLFGKEVWWQRKAVPFCGAQYDEGFVHLISRDNYLAGQRTFDLPRAERLAWCAAAITNAEDAAVNCFEYLEGNRQIRTYIWLKNYDYVVVLRQMPIGGKQVYWLVTAFSLDGSNSRDSLERKSVARIRA